MNQDKNFVKSRKIKQSFMGILFVLVLFGGWFYPLLGYFVPLCMVVGIWIAFPCGRKWCDWLCPRGSFFDAFIKPISPNKTIPKFFKGLPFRIGVLSFLMVMMIVQIILRWPDPYKIGMFFVLLLTATTILGIILALIFHQRTWCCFCPIGSMGNWIGQAKMPLRIDSNLCNRCQTCYKVCPIQIMPYNFEDVVKDGDCLKCNLCILACPKKALSLGRTQLRSDLV